MPVHPTPPPPMSTSSLPPSTKPFPVRPGLIKPPVLASDILREEVAPRTPARHAIRVALSVVTAAFLVAAALAWGVGAVRLTGTWALQGALAAAIVAGIAAVAPFPYAARAWLAVIAGYVPLVMGALNLGPLARLGDDGTASELATIAMATLLSAALVFRARYRAFRAARVILGAALVVSLPAVALLAMRAFDGSAGLGDRTIAAAGVASVAAATLGFMGAETSAGCAQWAAFVVGAVIARPAWHAVHAAWSGSGPDAVSLTTAALGELIATTLVMFALFQLLAAALAGQAREVDVHRAVGAGASDPGALGGGLLDGPDHEERDCD